MNGLTVTPMPFTYRKMMLTYGGDRPDVGHGFGAHFRVEPRDTTSDIRVIDYCLSIPGGQYHRHLVDYGFVLARGVAMGLFTLGYGRQQVSRA
jgi:hypothetical protein